MYCVDHIFSKSYQKQEIAALTEAGAKSVFITTVFNELHIGIETKINIRANTTEECEVQLYDGRWNITRYNKALYKIEEACSKIREAREKKIMATTIGKLRHRK